MSKKNFFLKKIILTIIICTIIFSILFNNIVPLFFNEKKIFSIKINQEKISPNIIQFLYCTNKNFNNVNNIKIISKNLKKINNKKNIYKNILMQIIYETLLKQYIQKIDFKIILKNIKKNILKSQYFKIKKKFNINKYLNFINFIKKTHNQYISHIKNKKSIEYFISSILKSEIFLNQYLKNKIKEKNEKRNVQIGYFNIFLTKSEKKIPLKSIKNYFILHKKRFFSPNQIQLQFLSLKKIFFKKKINNKKNIFNVNKNKKYRIIKIKKLKNAQLLLHNIQHTHSIKKTLKNFVFKSNNIYQDKKTDWMNKKYEPYFIKKLKLKKIGDVSKIIKYNNKYLIIILENKKKINDFTKIDKIKKTDWIYQDNFLKYKYVHPFNYFIQKKFFKKNYSFHKFLINIFKYKKRIYILKKYLYIYKKNQSFKNVYKKIKKILQKKKLIRKNSYLIKKFLSLKENKKNIFLKKYKLILKPTSTISISNKKNINYKKTLFNLPKLNKKKFIYTILYKKNNLDKLLILKNIFYKNINLKKKIEDIKKIKNEYRIMIIKDILKNIYKKSNIKYEKKIINKILNN